MKKKEQSSQMTNETKQGRLWKKTRGGQGLTKEQVHDIKEGRAKLRKQMKQSKVYTKKEFELTASSMGLYFDKHRGLGLFFWWLHGRALWALIGAAAALLAVMFLFSTVSQLRGHFTINVTDDMFKKGFVLSEDGAFSNPNSNLYSEPIENVPCISIKSLPIDIDNYDGAHNGYDYFAYTFYIRYENTKDDTVDYEYQVQINSESLNLSSATWLMLFEDGKATVYAKADAEGKVEALPALNDNTKGYRNLAMLENAADPNQFEVVATKGSDIYYRIIPKTFESDTIMASGRQKDVMPNDVHKYTVVLWLEGDDPDCTDELIGGNLGVEMNFRLLDSEESYEEGKGVIGELWDTIKNGLIFWED